MTIEQQVTPSTPADQPEQFRGAGAGHADNTAAAFYQQRINPQAAAHAPGTVTTDTASGEPSDVSQLFSALDAPYRSADARQIATLRV